MCCADAPTRGSSAGSLSGRTGEPGSNADEAAALAPELTVGETYFFRNNDQFRALADVVLPERMAARAGAWALNILSAGCSSGEEPYTIAMVARDPVRRPWTVSIRAVDLNPAAVKRAEAGQYGAWALRDTAPEIQKQWFEPNGRTMQLAPEIHDSVRFDVRNLADPKSDIWGEGIYDVVFCRNVIMYFPGEVQAQVIARIARALVPGGYLFLGHAETLRGLSHDFHLVHTHNTFYYRRRDGADEAPLHCPRTISVPPRAVEMPALADVDVSWFETIGKATERIEALTRMPLPVAQMPGPQWNLAFALDLFERERFADALASIDAMPPEAGGDPDVLLLQAILLVQGGRPSAAAEVCRALLAIDELNAGAHYVLALCFEVAHDRAAAVHHFRVASYLDPDFAMPRLHLGMLARRAGDPAEARDELSHSLDLLKREEASRLLLFGGGFTRDALIRLGEAELRAVEAVP